MVYRWSWIAGLGSTGFAFLQLRRLLRPAETGTPWPWVVLIAFALGAAVTWTLTATRLPRWLVPVVNGAGLALLAGRLLAVPGRSFLSFDAAGWARVVTELDRADEVVRHGVEPVLPLPGVVLLVAIGFWLLGALLAFGLQTGRPFLATLPPLALGAEFVIIDRAPTGVARIATFVVLLAATALAVAGDERGQGTGTMLAARRRAAAVPTTPPATALTLVAVAVVGASVLANAAAGLLPPDGTVRWRNPSSLTGEYYGSVAYNPFVDIRKGLLSQSPTPVFVARITGDVPADQVYFRLLTLDSFSGGQWFADDPVVQRLTERPWERPSMAFAGPEHTVTAEVEILALTQEWLPVPYSPVEMSAEADLLRALRVRPDDGSILFDGARSYTGMTYTVVSELPDLDPASLAATPEGTLSPLFAVAASDDRRVPDPVPSEPRELPDEDRFLELPVDLDPRIRAKARELTRLLETPFEKGVALENWFRERGGFVYDATVPPGHGSDTIAGWLFDTAAADYRRGYCEQFATSMAVMARAIGIPARVAIGFTPGELIAEDTVVVRDRNAHSWVDLWIPSQGWVRFDPTPRSDGINPVTYELLEDRLGFSLTAYLERIPEPERNPVETAGGATPRLADDPTPEPFFVGSGGDTETADGELPAWLVRLLGGLVVVAAAVGLIPAAKGWGHRARFDRLLSGDITAGWADVQFRLRDLGRPPDAAATPLELASEVDEALVPLARIYDGVVYGDLQPGRREALLAAEALRRTRARLVAETPWPRRALAWFRVPMPRRRPRRRR